MLSMHGQGENRAKRGIIGKLGGSGVMDCALLLPIQVSWVDSMRGFVFGSWKLKDSRENFTDCPRDIEQTFNLVQEITGTAFDIRGSSYYQY